MSGEGEVLFLLAIVALVLLTSKLDTKDNVAAIIAKKHWSPKDTTRRTKSTHQGKSSHFTPPSGDRLWCHVRTHSCKSQGFTLPCCDRLWCHIRTHRGKSHGFTPPYHDRLWCHISIPCCKLKKDPISPLDTARNDAKSMRITLMSREIAQTQLKSQKWSFLAQIWPGSVPRVPQQDQVVPRHL